jgi:hypothetical protein
VTHDRAFAALLGRWDLLAIAFGLSLLSGPCYLPRAFLVSVVLYILDEKLRCPAGSSDYVLFFLRLFSFGLVDPTL